MTSKNLPTGLAAVEKVHQERRGPIESNWKVTRRVAEFITVAVFHLGNSSESPCHFSALRTS
jgi:hypothetical protein